LKPGAVRLHQPDGIAQDVTSGTKLPGRYPCCFLSAKAAMQTTPASRASISGGQNHPANNGDGDNASLPAADEKKGYLHLLENTTLAEIMYAPWLHSSRSRIIHAFLVDGDFPASQKNIDFLAKWLVENQQSALLAQSLAFTPLVVLIENEIVARGLLAIMQSGLSFCGLTIQLDMSSEKEDLIAVIPLIEQAFHANPSITAIVIFSIDYCEYGLASLFDVLAGVKDLQLSNQAKFAVKG
jgi:hypothetical protein